MRDARRLLGAYMAQDKRIDPLDAINLGILWGMLQMRPPPKYARDAMLGLVASVPDMALREELQAALG